MHSDPPSLHHVSLGTTPSPLLSSVAVILPRFPPLAVMTDGWMGEVLARCCCRPIIGTRVGRCFAGSTDVGRDGRPSPQSLRTVSPSLELTSGGVVVYRPIGEALSRWVPVVTARARAEARWVVTSAHAGLPLTNDGLHTVERSSCHVVSYLPPP